MIRFLTVIKFPLRDVNWCFIEMEMLRVENRAIRYIKLIQIHVWLKLYVLE